MYDPVASSSRRALAQLDKPRVYEKLEHIVEWSTQSEADAEDLVADDGARQEARGVRRDPADRCARRFRDSNGGALFARHLGERFWCCKRTAPE